MEKVVQREGLGEVINTVRELIAQTNERIRQRNLNSA
jgi:hypothetical protein